MAAHPPSSGRAIDYDFYRDKARAHRAAAIGDAVSRLKGLLTRLAFVARPAPSC